MTAIAQLPKAKLRLVHLNERLVREAARRKADYHDGRRGAFQAFQCVVDWCAVVAHLLELPEVPEREAARLVKIVERLERGCSPLVRENYEKLQKSLQPVPFRPTAYSRPVPYRLPWYVPRE